VMSSGSLALLWTNHRNFDTRARITLLRLEMEDTRIVWVFIFMIKTQK